MAMKERLKAAALMMKCKVLLMKDKADTKKRDKKYRELKAKLDKKEDAARKGNDPNKIVVLQDAMDGIDLVLVQVKAYSKQIEDILRLVKETSIFDDTEKLQKFNSNVKQELKEQGRIYARYKDRKTKLMALLKKCQVAYKKDWDDRLIAWLKKDHPIWELFKKVGEEFLKSSTVYYVSIGKS